MVTVPLDIYSGVELLDHMVIIYLSDEMWNCFLNQHHHLGLPPALPTFIILFFFNYSHPNEYKYLLFHCGLIFISLKTNLGHLFMDAIHNFFEGLCESFADFYWVFFSLLSCKRALYYSQHYQVDDLQVSSDILGVVFSLCCLIYLLVLYLFRLEISSWVNFSCLSFLEIWLLTKLLAYNCL